MDKTYKKASQMTPELNRSNFNIPGEKDLADKVYPMSEIPFYMGVATPDTNPGVPDGKCFFDASTVAV
ncbi:MAG: hypothetical protein PF444_10125 [Bacteroidales bacterium]|nr:hypothetical protein [Bacteroidales bacterium]